MQAGRIISGVGRFLIGAGLLILAFTAFQLWATNLSESNSQGRLRTQFANLQRHSSSAESQPIPPGSQPGSQPPAQPAAKPARSGPATLPAGGTPIGAIAIPKIGVTQFVVQGTGTEDLRKGPGHYPYTPMPGQPGNSAIAGHRTTYGAPFYNLNELGPGDQIIVTTLQGTFRYSVFRSLVVLPTDISVVLPTATPTLTLTTCNPRYSASARLVVQASLVTPPAPAPAPAPLVGLKRSSPEPSQDNLAGGQGNWTPALLWGLALLGAAALVWIMARTREHRWARRTTYVAGTGFVCLILFFFFENVSVLLPASV